MNKNDLKTLFEYNKWANAMILDVASRLSSDEFLRDMSNSHASVRDTLVHIMGAEWAWLERWRGTSPKQMLPPTEFTTVDSIRTRWSEIERGQAEFLSNLVEDALPRPLSYTNFSGQRWTYPLVAAMQHLINHSTYHRGQVTTLLRQLGAKVVGTDFLHYYDALSSSKS